MTLAIIRTTICRLKFSSYTHFFQEAGLEDFAEWLWHANWGKEHGGSCSGSDGRCRNRSKDGVPSTNTLVLNSLPPNRISVQYPHQPGFLHGSGIPEPVPGRLSHAHICVCACMGWEWDTLRSSQRQHWALSLGNSSERRKGWRAWG